MPSFVLSMRHIPLYVSDNEIATAWNQYNGSLVKAVRFEPSEIPGKRKAIVWFTDLVENFPAPYWNPSLNISTIINNYKNKALPGSEKLDICNFGYLDYYSTTEEPTEFSFMVAFQLQDIVRQQANQIQELEGRLNQMEKTMDERTELFLHVGRSNKKAFDRMKSRVRSQNAYRKVLEANILSLCADQIEDTIIRNEEKEKLRQKIDALTEWCSQPLWKRMNSFTFMADEITSEF